MNRRRTILIALLLCVSIGFFPGSAQAVDETYFNLVVNSFVAPDFCGKSLADCPAGVSEEMKYQIRQMLGSGKTKEQIEEHFVNIHGLRILSAPPKKGFFLTAWIMPIVGIVLGGIMVYKVVEGKKTANNPNSYKAKREGKSKEIGDDYQDKLKDEMKKYL